MYTNDDEYDFDECVTIINPKQNFENFKNQNPIARNQYDYGYGKQYKKYGYGESGN